MRARMALLQAGQPFEVFEVVLRDKPAALLQLSPKGTVPVLRLPGGEVLEESWDIMRRAFATADEPHWWQAAQSPANLALLQRNDGAFKRDLDRYKYPGRDPDENRSRETVRADAEAALLLPLEARLQAERWLGGERPCATDLAIFPFVRQFAAVEPQWFGTQPLPALQAWLDAWLATPLFAACMAKLPSQEVVRFPMLPALSLR